MKKKLIFVADQKEENLVEKINEMGFEKVHYIMKVGLSFRALVEIVEEVEAVQDEIIEEEVEADTEAMIEDEYGVLEE